MTTFSRFLMLSTLLMFFCPTVSYSQYGRMKWKQRSSIDLVIGGDYGFRLIDGNSANPNVQELILNRQEHENQKLNYRFGFNYYQGLTYSIALKTGLRFANPGFVIHSVESFDVEQDINEIKKVFIPRGPEYKYEYQMIEIPLGVKYTIVGYTCEPYFEAGIAFNFYRETLVKEIGYDEKYTNKTTIEEAINNTNYIGFASVGGNFNLGDNVSGFTQLVGRYQFNNLRKGILVERIVSLGLEVGFRYYL